MKGFSSNQSTLRDLFSLSYKLTGLQFFFTASSQCISSHGNPTLVCSRSLGLFPKLHSGELSQESQTAGEELELRGVGKGALGFLELPGKENFFIYTLRFWETWNTLGCCNVYTKETKPMNSIVCITDCHLIEAQGKFGD